MGIRMLFAPVLALLLLVPSAVADDWDKGHRDWEKYRREEIRKSAKDRRDAIRETDKEYRESVRERENDLREMRRERDKERREHLKEQQKADKEWSKAIRKDRGWKSVYR